MLMEFARGQIERRQRRVDRHYEFQLEALIALQEALFTSARLTTRATWLAMANQPTDEEFVQSWRTAEFNVSKFAARTSDQRTRSLVRQYLLSLSRIATAPKHADLQPLDREFLLALGAVNRRIGELLRTP